MPKDTKTLGNSKARACESLGFVHKKGCARVLTQPPVPQVLTRDVTELTPDALYNQEIRQYNSAGTHLAGTTFAQATIGTALDVTLQVSDDCQLVIVARGDGKTVKTELGTRTLQKVQENITADSTVISRINPTDQSSMNKMPYVLHLKHVKVVQESGKYII